MVEVVPTVYVTLEEQLEEVFEGAVFESVDGIHLIVVVEGNATVEGVPHDVHVFGFRAYAVFVVKHVCLDSPGWASQSSDGFDAVSLQERHVVKEVADRGRWLSPAVDVVHDVLHPRGATLGVRHDVHFARPVLVAEGST